MQAELQSAIRINLQNCGAWKQEPITPCMKTTKKQDFQNYDKKSGKISRPVSLQEKIKNSLFSS
jgi:hypothetical protein